MIHPRLTAIDGSQRTWLADIGDYGAWGDLSWTTRWGQGASGMFEASWSMPLPADFEHTLLRRGTRVELMDSSMRLGSSLVMSEPARGAGYADPWTFTATGIGREVEGENSWYALDGSNALTPNPATAIDTAIAGGLAWAGRDATVPAFDIAVPAGGLITIGTLLNIVGDNASQRWGVWDDDKVGFRPDPTAPRWHVTPGSAALGTADDDYASRVLVVFSNSDSGGAIGRVFAENTTVANRYGRRTFPVDLTSFPAMSVAVAQGFANGILAKSKARLQWANGLTGLTSNDLLTSGGNPADLTMVQAGDMVRIHGIYNDLLEYNGQTYLDIVAGEVKYTDGAQTIDINPLGLAARDLAAVVEDITGMAVDAA